MYEKILLALEASPTDRPMVDHVKQLAAIMHSRVVLLHVLTGPAAQFHGSDADGHEVREARDYLERIVAEFQAAGVTAQAVLDHGQPARQIVKWVKENGCDLVAMGTHGHGKLADIFLGETASPVQHSLNVPVLLLREK